MVTQDVFDSKLSDLIEREVRFAYTCAVLHIQGDPIAHKREQELMMLQNVINSLRDYDVTSELLEDSDVELFFELGTTITLNWPHGATPIPFNTSQGNSVPSPAPSGGNAGKYPATVNLPAGEVYEVPTTITTVPYSINLSIYNNSTGMDDDISTDIGRSYKLVDGYYYIYLSSESALTSVKLKVLF
jgi:hypothetical protein